MPILGAHQSIAGGYHRAIERAHRAGCQCVQLFTKNNNQWNAPPITPQEAADFQMLAARLGIGHTLAHDSYLINLASPDSRLWRRSVKAFAAELRRAEVLGIPYLVTHPGCYTTADAQFGLRRIIQALNAVHAETQGTFTRCLLETTAGQGTSLGWRFEHLARIIDGVRNPELLGVCFDTCHVFAAGYALAPLRSYRATMRALEKTVGLASVKAVHLNDSARDRGSRVDRHAHIGQGKIGLAAFRYLLNDPRFQSIPMYLETPKGTLDGEDWDVVNLRILRRLVEGGDRLHPPCEPRS